MSNLYRQCAVLLTTVACSFSAVSALAAKAPTPKAPKDTCLFNDWAFHLTNYVQQGTDATKYVDQIMGDKVCRLTLFGIPLWETWAHGNSGDFAPTDQLQTDAPLYHYSFTDAYIARVFQKLRAGAAGPVRSHDHRLQPCGHVRGGSYPARARSCSPAVFSGIGEFTIHKEFVIWKIAGETASLTDPALDRILDFAGEVGPGRDPAQRHRHAVCQGGRRAGLPDADEGPAASPPQDLDHLGAAPVIVYPDVQLAAKGVPRWQNATRITLSCCRRCSKPRRSRT